MSSNIWNFLSDDDVEVFLRLYTLLYADDTIIFAASSSDLQSALNAVNLYCETWKLSVNTIKTKIVIFSRGKIKKYPQFYFGNGILEVVVNIVFNYNGNFHKAIDKQVKQAKSYLQFIVKNTCSKFTFGFIC